ncbi:gliding motility protein GldM [Mucilaginibacter sp. RS28]|uniref:Gliding motility protein GldM n=1 Tax=Mucilaginibacter straminoryzae TaxID=2932774 RepID=A0A9X1X892_9SPHI|nr:gliding motility protein GldM [Mucilaginibacter straminoryzae]MCJ8210394.1 gliding motility protein GldM [Mucilaginibacter straminoryzae]
MAGGKETPRQRMIGILYLVLLGLVALNVPDSLLNAFKNISDSLTASKNNVQTGINNTFDAFEKTKLKEQPERAKPLYDKAKQAATATDELNAYVEELKKQLIDAAGGFDENINDYKGRDNLDISADLMINKKKGEELRKKIDETREKLLSLLDEKDRATTKLALEAVAPEAKKGNAKLNWEEAYFGDGIPMGAAMTSLNKVEADAKNSESEVIKKILGKVDQAVVNLDKFNAVAVAPSSYVIAGQPYTAQVYLTAYDSRSNPNITVNGSTIPVKEGIGTYTTNTSREGVYTWVGNITVKQNDGATKTYSVRQTYQVAKPSAVVSPDKMNVLYIGVENPVSVSAPGIPMEKLKVNISSGSLSGSNGHYTAKVSSIGTAKVTVSGEVAPGKTQVLGTTEFRVKRIPDPKAQFAGKSSGAVGTANLKAQDRVFARLENFDFDAKFNVTRFTLWVAKPRQDPIQLVASGPDLTSAMRSAMATITPGTRVYFTNIVAVGPDGTQRGLDDIVLLAN